MTQATLETYGLPESIVGNQASVFDRIEDRVDLGRTIRTSLIWSLAASAIFGATLGGYGHSLPQVLSSAIKVSVLLFGTTALCFPTFQVLQALQAPKALSLPQAVTLHAHSLATTAVVWAALSLPLFFLVGTTQHYGLAQALALFVGGIGGLVGALRLFSGYRRLCRVEHTRRHSIVLLLYVVIYGMVGAQLAWVLRPFIGSPSLSFQVFRNLEGSIFGHVARMLGA